MNGRIQEKPTVGLRRKVDDADASFPSGIIIGVSTKQAPHAAGGVVEAVKDGAIVPGMRLYRIRQVSGNAQMLEIIVGPYHWELVDARPVELLNDEREIALQGGIDVFVYWFSLTLSFDVLELVG